MVQVMQALQPWTLTMAAVTTAESQVATFLFQASLVQMLAQIQ